MVLATALFRSRMTGWQVKRCSLSLVRVACAGVLCGVCVQLALTLSLLVTGYDKQLNGWNMLMHTMGVGLYLHSVPPALHTEFQCNLLFKHDA